MHFGVCQADFRHGFLIVPWHPIPKFTDVVLIIALTDHFASAPGVQEGVEGARADQAELSRVLLPDSVFLPLTQSFDHELVPVGVSPIAP